MPMPGWGDFGMGLDEEERKRAMRLALFKTGIGINSRAATQGMGAFAGMGGEIGAGLYDAGNGILEQRAAQAKARQAMAVQAQEAEARQLLAQKRRQEILSGDAEGDEKAREVERRKAAVESVKDPQLKGELSLRIGQTNFWDVYDKKRLPPADPKAPETKSFADDTTRVWNPTTATWDVVARKPAAAAKEPKEPKAPKMPKGRLSPEEIDLAARKAAGKRLMDYEKDLADGKLPPPPPTIPAQAIAARKARLDKYLAEERDRLAFEQGSDQGEKSGDIDSAIASLLSGVPPSKRRAAEAELRAAFAAGKWRP